MMPEPTLELPVASNVTICTTAGPTRLTAAMMLSAFDSIVSPGPVTAGTGVAASIAPEIRSTA
jgi:hypothetical protein